MSGRPIITPMDNGYWRLVEEWDGIPAGFMTDGGSIPRLLWRVIGPPVDAQTIAPFIRHDWNYTTGRVKRKAADRQLYNDLRAAGVGRIRAYTIYAGVRAFGASHYNKTQTPKEKTMKKLIAITITAALAAIATGCATKSRSFDAKGMYVSETGQLAVGYVHVDAIPEGTESAVVHYEEDVALLSPSTKTHAIDIILTGTNSVGSAGTIVSSICKAFVSVAPSVQKASADAASPIDLAKANADNATAAKLANAEAKQATENAKPSSGEPLQGDADCATGACEDK